MTDKRPPPAVDDRDFDAIEAAVMETERGRWFLGEFARRNRTSETRLLLEAVTRLEQNAGGPRPADEADLVRAELARMAKALADAVAALGAGQDGGAALEGFVQSVATIEGATSDIHDSAERVSEIAWQLREAGASGRLCSALEQAAAHISTACAFGGLTARRAKVLAEAVNAILQGLEALPPAWRPVMDAPPARAAHIDEAPAAIPPAVSRASETPHERARSDAPRAAPVMPVAAIPIASEPTRHDARRQPAPSAHAVRAPVPSLQALDRLDFRERLKLFT